MVSVADISMSDGLFDLEPQRPLLKGDAVEVAMPWNEVWHCRVKAVRHQAHGWPVAELEHARGTEVDEFSVDVARCRLVSDQPALEGL